jgi:hypothetical protein
MMHLIDVIWRGRHHGAALWRGTIGAGDMEGLLLSIICDHHVKFYLLAFP